MSERMAARVFSGIEKEPPSPKPMPDDDKPGGGRFAALASSKPDGGKKPDDMPRDDRPGSGG